MIQCIICLPDERATMSGMEGMVAVTTVLSCDFKQLTICGNTCSNACGECLKYRMSKLWHSVSIAWE